MPLLSTQAHTALTPRSGFISGMGGAGGEVDMSAYQSMAASLQAQGLGQVSATHTEIHTEIYRYIQRDTHRDTHIDKDI